MTNVTEKLKFVLGRVENIVWEGENAGYQHFILLLCFQKASFPRVFNPFPHNDIPEKQAI